ncbi:MAG: tetratricopeptide repeat protein [Candidatus Promineifilaceae bacterium]
MLEISLLGEVTIQSHGKSITRFRSQKEIALLAYLAHSGQTHSREALADLLWEARSTTQSLSNLRTVLARLRKQVGDDLIVTRKTVAVTPAVHEQTDSVRFQAMVAGAGGERSITAVNLLKQGLELYRAEMMAGFYLPNAPRFNDWLVIEQERLHQTAMRGYRQLAGWQEEQGVFSAGVTTAQRWVSWDPLDETAQQQLMRLLAYDGRISEAITVYEKCRQLLGTELGLSPAPATTALNEAIQTGSLSTPDISPAPLHNLPRMLTPLFGRKKEIEELTTRLLNPDYPLISITGAGGIGKTSLALAATRALAGKQHPFKDGIWFIALEEIEDGEPKEVRNRVAALIGLAMGLFFHGEDDLWSQLLGQLAPKNLLLILDNIEQFLNPAADLIVALLEAGNNIHLLVTSLITLPLAATFAFPLAGLEVPIQDSAEALQNESVRLFAERAARIPTSFRLEKHLAQVVAICRFVEGMPLAIELAAASLGWLMVDEILPVLTSNLQLLNTNRRDLPARQRTLQAVFDYTWQLRDRREQHLLTQISIFLGGFGRQAAEAVLDDKLSSLYKLQDHALLSRDEMGRFRIHPLLRQLARKKLTSEMEQQTLDRHALYYTALAQSFEKELKYSVGQVAIQTMRVEQANVRAAWHHAVQTGQWQNIANCLESIHFFYRHNGLYQEESVLLGGAIASLQANLIDENRFLTGFLTRLLCRLLALRAWNYQYSGEYDEGLKTAERACQLAQKLADPGLEAHARVALAKLHYRNHAEAIAQYEQVVTLAKIAQNPILEAEALSGIGGHKKWQGEIEQAKGFLRHALDLCRTLHYKPGEMVVLVRLGGLSASQEAHAEAMAYERQALQLSRLLGDVVAEALVLGNIGVSLNVLGDLAASQHYQEQGLAIYHRLNMPGEEQMLLGGLGEVAIKLGDYVTAEQHLTEALALAEQVKDLFWQAWVKHRLGEMWHGRGESEKALAFIAQAIQTAEAFQYINFKAGVLYTWGNVLLSQGEWGSAEEKFQKAYDLRQGSGRTEQALPSLAGLAYATYQQEKPETAASLAERLWESLRAAPVVAERATMKLYWMLGMVWDGLGDGRANDLWARAYDLLRSRCDKIPDERRRKLFLEQISSHRAIIDRSQIQTKI